MTRGLAFLLLALIVAAPVPSSAELRDKFTPIRIVGLGPIADPDNYEVVANGAADQYDSRTFLPHTGARSLKEAMDSQDLHMGAELREAIIEGLLGAGIEVVPAETRGATLKLLVAIMPNTTLYSDAALGDDLMPGFMVKLFVTDARSGRFLKTDSIVYGQSRRRADHSLFPDARYRFSSVDALLADPKSAADGFRAGIEKVAQEIVKEFGHSD